MSLLKHEELPPSALTHIERAIERINYHILDYVPMTMCQTKLIDTLFFLCVMLTNLQPPLSHDLLNALEP